MSGLSRRGFVVAGLGAGLLAGATTAAGAGGPGTTLREALERRRSTRSYAQTEIDDATLHALLWSAIGVNRTESGGRTAPSWRTSYGIDVCVADRGGVRRYDPASASLGSVLADDVRGRASPQPFVATAPAVLVYVADLARMYAAPREEQVQAAHVDAGIIAQNVYLFCASAGLGTCLVGGADRQGLAALLKLPDTQFVTFVQPVGHPSTNG